MGEKKKKKKKKRTTAKQRGIVSRGHQIKPYGETEARPSHRLHWPRRIKLPTPDQRREIE
jgi:hypothetical protein